MNKLFKGALALVCVYASVIGSTPADEVKIDYPARTVRLLVPAAPGAGTDAMARFYAREFESLTGSTMVVVNQSGGGGLAAFQSLVSARPDGATLLFYHSALHVAHAAGRSPIGATDMKALATLGALNEGYVTRADAPYSTIKELIEYANAEGRSVLIGMQMGGGTQLKALALSRMAKEGHIRLVDAGSEAQRTPQLLGGQLDVSIMGINSALQYEKNGDIKVLAVAAAERDPAAPQWPTAVEQGVDISMPVVFTLYGPKKLGAELVSKLDAINAAIGESEEFTQGIQKVGSAPAFRTSEQAGKYVEVEAAQVKSML